MDLDRASLERLSDGNYYTWSARMVALLIQKDLRGAVTSDDGEAASLKARALIRVYVRDQHLSTVRGYATATEAWTAQNVELCDHSAKCHLCARMTLGSVVT
jgi:hypothetical protein